MSDSACILLLFDTKIFINHFSDTHYSLLLNSKFLLNQPCCLLLGLDESSDLKYLAGYKPFFKKGNYSKNII